MKKKNVTKDVPLKKKGKFSFNVVVKFNDHGIHFKSNELIY